MEEEALYVVIAVAESIRDSSTTDEEYQEAEKKIKECYDRLEGLAH